MPPAQRPRLYWITYGPAASCRSMAWVPEDTGAVDESMVTSESLQTPKEPATR